MSFRLEPRNGHLAVTGGKCCRRTQEVIQIFAVFLLCISVLNLRLLQMRHGSQNILLAVRVIASCSETRNACLKTSSQHKL